MSEYEEARASVLMELTELVDAVGKLLETEDSSSFGVSFNEEAIEALRKAHSRAKNAAERMGRAIG